VLTHPDLRKSARIQRFIDHIAANFSERRDLLSGAAGSPSKKSRFRKERSSNALS
jgi:hypothetical protein